MRFEYSQPLPDLVPIELVDAWRRGNVATFLGAGVSMGSGLPSWSGLMDGLRSELPDIPSDTDLPTVAYYFELARGRHRLLEVVTRAVRGGQPNKLHRAIAELEPQLILTTNFDGLAEQALRERGAPAAVASLDHELPFLSSDAPCVIKLHGDARNPETLVISSRDFELYEATRPGLARYLASVLQTKTILFIGYSVSDPTFRMLLRRARHEAGDLGRNSYAVTFAPSTLEQMELRARGITCIDLGAAAADPTAIAAAWVNRLRQSASVEPRQPTAGTQVILGKHDRARRIASEIDALVQSSLEEDRTIRMRQGFGALSLADVEYPADPEYSALLRNERDAVLRALATGCEVRLIISRRPLFSSDLVKHTPEDVVLARRLQARCARLVERIEEILASAAPGRLIVTCSGASSFADIAIGSRVVLRGVRTDSSSGYEVTVVSDSANDVSAYLEQFDAELALLAGSPTVSSMTQGSGLWQRRR